MSDDEWRQLAHDNPGMAIYRQFNPQTMSGTRSGAAMREALSPAEVHELIDELADSGLMWSPPVDITRAEADGIRARWATEVAAATRLVAGLVDQGAEDVEYVGRGFTIRHEPPRRRWWHRFTRR